MPVITEHTALPAAEEIRAHAAKDGYGHAAAEVVEAVSAKYGIAYIGSGDFTFVLQSLRDDTVVYSFPTEGISRAEAAAAFYLQRIYSTLWPHNFPRLYSVFTNESLSRGVYIYDKVTGKKPDHHPLMHPLYQSETGFEEKARYPFSQVMMEKFQRGIPLVLEDEIGHANFILNEEDGGEYYVDRLIPPVVPFPVDHIIQFMEEKNRQGSAFYTDSDMDKARKSMLRLNEIRFSL